MATQALRYLSGQDGYIPQATSQLIAYVRKESEFSINKYVQYVPSPAPTGLYAILGRDQFVRVVSSERFAWEDGNPRPSGEWNKVPFQYAEFRTFRRTYGWSIGHVALETTSKFGSWNPKPIHVSMATSQCLTDRTNRTAKLLQTSASWPSTNTGDVNSLNGNAGGWLNASDDPNSPNYLAIFKSLAKAAQTINLLTNGKVKPSQLQVIVSPDLALGMAESPEIVNYCRESPFSKEILERGFDPQYTLWGLPQTYKGFKFTVDDTNYVNVEPNTTTQTGNVGQVPEASLGNPGRQYAYSPSSAVITSRVGGLDGETGAPSFSTVQIYHYKGLVEVEARDLTWDRMIEGAVTEQIAIVLAAAFAGFLITGVNT